jgi:type I restriction enzyme S subunit
MYEQISENWHWVELQDVCQRIKVGLATSVTKYYAENGVPIIRNLNIKQG